MDRHRITVERFGVRSMPTLLFFKEGRVVKQMVGSVSRAKLEDAIRAVVEGVGHAGPHVRGNQESDSRG